MLAIHAPVPFRMMDNMMADHMIDSMMTDALMGDLVRTRHVAPRTPKLSAHEASDHYTLVLTAPGVSPADLKIEAVTDNKVSVAGKTRTRSIDCCITLPADANMSNASAECSDGLLTITVPKRAAAAPVRIEVSSTADDEATPGDDEPRPYSLTIVAAGIAAKDMEVSAKDGKIHVHGASARTGARLERRVGLPRDADVAKASASHVDGILTLSVPKRPPAEPMRIEVNGEPAAAVKKATDTAPAVEHTVDVKMTAGPVTEKKEDEEAVEGEGEWEMADAAQAS